MKTLQGKLTIIRTRSNQSDGYVAVQVKDMLSGCEVIEARISLAEFVEALFGAGFRQCEFDLNDSGVVGKQHEHKQVEIFIPSDLSHRTDEGAAGIRAAIAVHEVDGWRGRDEDARNSHRWTRTPTPKGQEGHWMMIAFHRWVDAESKS